MSDGTLRARARLQRLVLSANGVPLLRRANALPYSAALHALGRLCDRTPGVRGAFVRSGLAREGWTPGLSDIDPLVILDAELTIASEQRAAALVTSSYRRLQRVFPMLGELEIVSERHLEARVGHGVDAGAATSWLRIGDPPALASTTAFDPAATQALAALRAYRYHLLPWCWSARSNDPRAPFVLGRAHAKLERSLGLPATPRPYDGSRPALLVSALATLSDTLGEPAGGGAPRARALEHALTATEPRVTEAELPATLSPGCLAALDCAFAPTEAPERLYVVLAADAVADDRRRCVEELLERVESPLVVDRRVLAHLLLEVDPLEHFTLLASRAVSHGNDPLPLGYSLGDAALRRSVLGYAVDMLGYPFSDSWADLPDRAFRDVVLGWFVRTACYLEDGVVETGFETQRTYYRERFPDLAAKVDPDDGSGTAEARFEVLRSLVDVIQAGMEPSGP